MNKLIQFIFMLVISLGTFLAYSPSLFEQWQTQNLPEQGLYLMDAVTTALPWNESWKIWKNYLQKNEALLYERAKNSDLPEKLKTSLEPLVLPTPTQNNFMALTPSKPLTDKTVPAINTKNSKKDQAPTILNTQDSEESLNRTNKKPIFYETPFNKHVEPIPLALTTENSEPVLLIPTPNKILLVGDSMAGSLEHGLKRLLRHTQIINKHRHSTGLTVRNYYDWPEQFKDIEEEAQPDFIISMLGTNDAQSIFYQGKIYNMQSSKWDLAYAERATAWKEKLDATGKPYLVVGMPHMRDNNFDQRMQRINAILAPLFSTHFLNLSNQLLDGKGHYDESLRASDGIHFAGGAINKISTLILEKQGWTQQTIATQSSLPPIK